MVYFVGAGSGAPDLITVRGKNLLEQADVIIYAGSLVNPELLSYKKEGCEVYNSATMTLEEVLTVMEEGDQKGCEIVRLHVFMARSVNRWIDWMRRTFHMRAARVSAHFAELQQP